ncbi:MAG: valine--tRNA ligase [Bacteroidota bacterium]
MEIPKTYDASATESKWYSYWMDKKFFSSVPDEREPYTIVIPPPNVTGVLHMGHMLNNTIQDVLIRRARMLGKNACWVPGTDHASIATEAKVVALLKEQGINKKDLSREDFLKHAWEWKEKYGGIILKQLEKLGASCDWDRTKFTMDADLTEAVIDVFIDLYNKGKIYRGVRMVNWDPQGLTAVSDEEVQHKEVNSKLYYVRYKIEGTADEWITVATTRPETILGDTAICVHPNDERYAHLKEKKAIVPIVNRAVPIIYDDYIDLEFGTGALKVTPAHDINDYNLGIKHKLEVIDVLNENGTISTAAGHYIGEDRFAVRKKIAIDLDAVGHIVKIEDIKNKVGYSERTNAVIEPRLSMQWFLKMSEISEPALKNVMNDNIKLLPEKFKNTYNHWMENVHDWCISRQLWWGQRIPAWYDNKGNTVVCKTKEEAFEKFKIQDSNFKIEDLRQDEDVLDTWFSSWLWPLTVFDPKIIENGWEKANKDLKYYYPTNDLVTAPEILFFWVARMIIAGYEYTGQKPFTNVYLTGIVRDKQGRKMSKSLGNSPDPLDLITKYGADGVRVGMLFSSPAGNDLLFDEGSCEQGRNFWNKIWNAFRLIKGWKVDATLAQPDTSKLACSLFDSVFNSELEKINDHYAKYRMSDALMATYKLVWDDFCSYYLEKIKPAFVDGESLPIDKTTYDTTIAYFENILKVLHPLMPFITEELWHLVADRTEKDCIIVAKWPEAKAAKTSYITTYQTLREIETEVKNFFNKNKVSAENPLNLKLTYNTIEVIENNKLNNFNEIVYTLLKKGTPKLVANIEIEKGLTNLEAEKVYFTIVRNTEALSEEDKAKLKQELEYTRGFLQSVQAKLANEKFVANAKPEMVENERKKQADAVAKIAELESLVG